MNGSIYLLTFPNGKGYVGQTVTTVGKRLSVHRSRQKGVSAVSSAFTKHGEPDVTLLAEGIDNQSDLDRIEVLLIAGMGTIAPQGYNLENGGRGRGTVSDESRARMSVAQCARFADLSARAKHNQHLKGKPLSAEHRANMSAARMGVKRGPYKTRTKA